MKQIVVGVDGSRASDRALVWALEVARSYGDAAMVLVHAYRSPAARTPYAYAPPFLPPATVRNLVEQEREWHEQQEGHARRHAEGLLEAALQGAGGAPEGVVIKRVTMAVDPASALLEVASDADVLVVGSRGLGGFKGLLLGSVSQQCVHHAPCPVVVVR